MRKLKAAVIGLGYIGASHVEAIRRIIGAEVTGVLDSDVEFARRKAELLGVEKVYTSLEELLGDPEVDIVHNCTPNSLHASINKEIMRAGKHLFSEKPLARDSAESAELAAMAARSKGAAAVNFNYRMNPMVQEIKARIAHGDIGEVTLLHGSYLQDWLLYDTDYNWRIEPEVCGISRCVADIGSHWMDAVQAVTGHRISEVCADLKTVIPVRKKPSGQVETFSTLGGEYELKEVATEDWGAVLFRTDKGASGVFYVSEVSAGHGCFFNFEINGSKASLAWNQESNDRLWMGFRDRDNILAVRAPDRMYPEARAHTNLAMGHPEGWNDAFTGNMRAFYTYVRKKYVDGLPTDETDMPFATFEEAHRIICLTEAIVKSAAEKRWITL